jgi:hypothetical protein
MRILLTLLLVLSCYGFGFSQNKKSEPPKGRIFVLYADGITDDTEALNAWGRGDKVLYKEKPLKNILENKTMLFSWKVRFNRKNSIVRYNTFIIEHHSYDRAKGLFDFGPNVRFYQNNIVRERFSIPKCVHIPITIAKYFQ